MASQPAPQPQLTAEVVVAATHLTSMYADAAVSAGRSALCFARHAAIGGNVDLWERVVDLLAVQEELRRTFG